MLELQDTSTEQLMPQSQCEPGISQTQNKLVNHHTLNMNINYFIRHYDWYWGTAIHGRRALVLYVHCILLKGTINDFHHRNSSINFY